MKVNEKKDILKNGHLLYTESLKHRGDEYGLGYKKTYLEWQNTAVDFFNKNKIKDYEYLFYKVDYPFFINKGIASQEWRSYSGRQNRYEQVNNFLALFKKQIDFLSNNGKTTIFLDKAKMKMYIDENRSYSFRKVTGKSKRFQFILKLINSGKAISSLKTLGYDNYQRLSTDKKEINDLLMKDLDTAMDFIVRGEGGGYELNREYYNFVPKS